MFACKIKSQKYPKEDETVITKTLSLDNDVVIMSLLEYNNIQGLVLNNELSKKRVRSIHQITKVGNTEVCQVMHVDQAKGYVDLSLKKVSDEEHEACIKNYTRNCVAYQIMTKLSRAVKKDIETLYEDFGYEAADKYGGLYTYFYRIKEKPELLGKTKESVEKAKESVESRSFEEKTKELEEKNNQHAPVKNPYSQHAPVRNPYREELLKIVEEQFKTSEVKVRIDVDVSTKLKGIEFLKEAFREALKVDKTLEITLLKSPTYSIVKISEDKDSAMEIVNQAADAVKMFVEESGDHFAITKPATVYGEKIKHEGSPEEEESTESN